MSEATQKPLKLFYCYAHEDKTLRDTLDSHLSSLKWQNLIEIWYDGQISAGTEWENEIDKHLGTADIVLLLVSAAFLNSKYCYGKEMAQALQRHKEGTARVVPIILRPVYWKNAPFSKLQILPTGAKPVTSWLNLDEAYEDIVGKLDEVVKEIQALREVAVLVEEGAALENSQQYEEALFAYEQAIRLDPNYADAYKNKGDALFDLKEYEKAIEAFEQAIRLNPTKTAYNYNRGAALYYLKRYEEALVAYNEAIQLNPNYANAYNLKGRTFHELKRYDQAIEAFEQAIQLDPKEAIYYNDKGNTLYNLERYEEALVAYDEAIRLNPNNASAYANKGNTLIKLKR